MYPQGYIRQRLMPDGWHEGACELLNRENAPIRRVLDQGHRGDHKDGRPEPLLKKNYKAVHGDVLKACD